jgi:hypothetical protein
MVVMMEEILEVMVEVLVVGMVVMKEGMLEVMEEEMKVTEEIQAVMTTEQFFMHRPLVELVVMEILVDLVDMEVMFIDLNSFKYQCELRIKLR